MMTIALSLTVDVPQLERLCMILEQIRSQLMADFATFNATLQQLSQSLTEVIATLQADTADQAHVDAAVATLQGMQAQLDALRQQGPPTP
jgi:hypothetical protein